MVQDAIIELSLWSKFHVNVTILKALFFSFFFNKGSKVLNHSNSMCSSCGLVIHCGSAVWHNYLLADEGVNKQFLVCVWSWHHLVTVCMIIGIVFHFCVEEKHHFCMVYIINFLWTNHFTWWCLTHASSSFFFFPPVSLLTLLGCAVWHLQCLRFFISSCTSALSLHFILFFNDFNFFFNVMYFLHLMDCSLREKTVWLCVWLIVPQCVRVWPVSYTHLTLPTMAVV